jgi:hypothetical protein
MTTTAVRQALMSAFPEEKMPTTRNSARLPKDLSHTFILFFGSSNSGLGISAGISPGMGIGWSIYMIIGNNVLMFSLVLQASLFFSFHLSP